jgi:MCRA family
VHASSRDPPIGTAVTNGHPRQHERPSGRPDALIPALDEGQLAGRLPSGALDGTKEPKKRFVIRGGKMENNFECLRDLFRSIPSLEIEGASGSCPRNAGGGALVS